MIEVILSAVQPLTVFVMATTMYVLAFFRSMNELHGYVPNWRRIALLLFALLTFLYFLVPGTLMYFMGVS